MPIQIEFCSGEEIDTGIANGEFFRIRHFPETPEGERLAEPFFEKQSKLIEDLERRMNELYGGRAFVSDNLWPSEMLKIEIGAVDVTKQLMLAIALFLSDHRSSYCVGIAVYSGSLQDKDWLFLGRIFISVRRVVLENTLKALFQEMVRKT